MEKLNAKDLRSHRAIVTAALCLLLAACGFAGLSLWMAVSASDAVSMRREEDIVRGAIHYFASEFGKQLEAQTIWDEAYEKSAGDFDRDWASNNFGSYLTETFGTEYSFLTDIDGKVLFATIGGNATDVERGAPFAEALRRAAIRLRDLEHAKPNSIDEVVRDVNVGSATVRFRRTQLLVDIAGEPAVLNGLVIIPDSSAPEFSGVSRYLFSVRCLDASVLAEIATRYGINKLRWAAADEPKNAAALRIDGFDGKPIGSLVWQPSEPGQQVLERAALGMLAAMALLLFFVLVVVSISRRYISSLASERARAEFLAEHDTLTGLTNRRVFERRLADEARRTFARRSSFALLSVDLDLFKELNDSLGHQAGDEALRIVARRLQSVLPGGATIARVGGDEFSIIVPGTSRAHIATLSKWLIDSISEPLELASNRQSYLGASVGIAMMPEDASSAALLSKRADLALYEAKKAGRGRCAFFEQSMEASQSRQYEVETALRLAIAERRIDIAYQPIVTASGERVASVEALARWTDPKLGVVSPGEFIVTAERCGLIGDLGELILTNACRKAVDWPEVSVAVNISAVQFQQTDVVQLVERTLQETGLPAARLEIELTETALFGDEELAANQIKRLRALGVAIALDDFGTGYSSLSLLRKFKFDHIKIDRSFIKDIEDSVEASAIVRSVISMATSLGAAVVGEGVETVGQRLLLEAAGCTYLQGYHFGRPASAYDIDRLMNKRLAA